MQHTEHPHEAVRIHIDREVYFSPTATTRHALYELAEIPANEVLFIELAGNQEDQRIPNDMQAIHMEADQHFYTGPLDYHIVINANRVTVQAERLTFEEIVALAFPADPSGENVVIAITYRRGENNRQGSLLPGQSVKVREGMIFNVTATNKS